MTVRLRIDRAGPHCTIQDLGRPGWLAHGISASGPMDRAAFHRAGAPLDVASRSAIEFTPSGLDLTVEAGALAVAWAGGAFSVSRNGKPVDWPGSAKLGEGDNLAISPGPQGNYGYLRFDREIDLPQVLGSQATNMRASIGGLEGRALRQGDILRLGQPAHRRTELVPHDAYTGPIRFVWGLHAEYFSAAIRHRFTETTFVISSALDRMGVRLRDDEGVFAGSSILSLVSDPVLPGDIQILGDGSPIVLMRDHQPTGGYPRIGTIITADLDRFAQLRPGTALTFAPIGVEHAHKLSQEARS